MLSLNMRHESARYGHNFGILSTHLAQEPDQLNDKDHSDHGEDNSEDGSGEECDPRAVYIDLELPKEKKGKKAGRPTNALMTKLTVPCYKVGKPEKEMVRCVGGRCLTVWSNRNRKRIQRHASQCVYVPAVLRNEVNEALKQRAPSTVLEEAQKKREGEDEEPSKKKQRLDKAGKAVHVPFFDQAKDLGRNERRANQNLQLAIMISSCMLPANLLDQPSFKDYTRSISSNLTYVPPTRDELENDIIPAEAAAVDGKQLDRLRKSDYLTGSFDGGTMRGREAYWTSHVTTPEGEAYMILGREATAVSHTANWLVELATEVGEFLRCDSNSNTDGDTGH